MEEMSRDDKINKIYSYAVVLLIHLIKEKAEHRTTRSWEFSIRNAIREIYRTNRRRKSGGFYVSQEEIVEILEEAYQPALEKAAFEVFEGQYDDKQLGLKVDKTKIINGASRMIQDYLSI
jgi:hypothetical protein